MTTQYAAGVLPFFYSFSGYFSDKNATKDCEKIEILLGLEYRERYNTHAWMEFGGGREVKKNGELETLAETACREFNEETAYAFNLSLEQVEVAERFGHYVDLLNEKTGVFYRMYCVKFYSSVFIEDIKAKMSDESIYDHVEKIDWKYFDAKDVIFSEDGTLSTEKFKIYPTSLIRLKMLRDAKFLEDLMV